MRRRALDTNSNDAWPFAFTSTFHVKLDATCLFHVKRAFQQPFHVEPVLVLLRLPDHVRAKRTVLLALTRADHSLMASGQYP